MCVLELCLICIFWDLYTNVSKLHVNQMPICKWQSSIQQKKTKTLRRVLKNTEECKNCKRTLVDYSGLEIVPSQNIKWYANIIVTLSL